MKRTCLLFWVIAVIVFVLLSATTATVIADMDMAEPSDEPAIMFLAGIGLIGLAALTRRRLIK